VTGECELNANEFPLSSEASALSETCNGGDSYCITEAPDIENSASTIRRKGIRIRGCSGTDVANTPIKYSDSTCQSRWQTTKTCTNDDCNLNTVEPLEC